MASILKLFRIIFFYALYFLLCMVVVVTVLQGWPIGGQTLFSFGLPIILVWWQERRRARNALSKLDKVEEKKQGRGSPNTAPRLSNEKNVSEPSISSVTQIPFPQQPPELPKPQPVAPQKANMLTLSKRRKPQVQS